MAEGFKDKNKKFHPTVKGVVLSSKNLNLQSEKILQRLEDEAKNLKKQKEFDPSDFQVRWHQERDNASIDVVKREPDGDLDHSQNFVYSNHDPEEIHDLIEDGFVKHFGDDQSLLKHLHEREVI